jgi:hypothetical protein
MAHLATHSFFPKRFRFLMLLFICIGCSSTQPVNKSRPPKPLSYPVAPQTSRSDIVAEAVITLTSFTFTIEYADAQRDYEALRTNWRMSTQATQLANDEVASLQVRDRAVLHLSRRGVEAGRSSAVASTLEFEMEIKGAKKDQWLGVTPDPAFQEQYAALVNDLKNRLRHRGYQFN